MSGTFKMTKLDCYTAKSSFISSIAALSVIAAVFATMSNLSLDTLLFTATWYALCSANNIFMTSDKHNLNRLYASLDLAEKDFVRGRYLFFYVNYLAALATVLVIGIFFAWVTGTPLFIPGVDSSFFMSFLLFTAAISVQIPVCMRLPYAKAQYFVIMIYVITIAVLLMIIRRWIILPLPQTPVGEWVLNISYMGKWMLNMLYLLASAAILAVSYPIAVRCCRKRQA